MDCQISGRCLKKMTLNDCETGILVKRLFQIYKSEQNGWVYDVNGLSPTIMVGCHSGVAPVIIEYEER